MRLVLSPITIRLARETDVAALQRLAQRDTRPVPGGRLLIAERDGVVDAALSLDSGQAIADPFKPSAELVALLRARAAVRDAPPSMSLRRRRFTPRLAGGSL
jgi:hypothetical protein